MFSLVSEVVADRLKFWARLVVFQFEQFISYLKQRERAGVVKIGAGEGMWPRMLYILPWSIEACALLAISPQPTNCLIGLMLPSLSTFA